MNALVLPPVVLYGLEAVKEINAFKHENATGKLTSFGFGQAIPPEYPHERGIRNVYFLTEITGTRGNHAHLYLHQILTARHGAFDLHLDDGMGNKKTYRLDNRLTALYVPPMTWRTLDNFTPDGECMVLSSQEYGEDEYIRNDYDEFLKIVARVRRGGRG